MTSTLDPAVLAVLAAPAEDTDAVRRLARTYLAELPGRRLALRAAAQRGDRRTVRAQAHALLRAGSVLGLAEVAAHGRRLATDAAPGGPLDDDALRALVAEHDAACDAADAGLRAWLRDR